MYKKKTKKPKPIPYERNIEDAPFYTFTYKHDELPLDPAISFIEEQILKLRQARSKDFTNDLDLYKQREKIQMNNEDLVIPSWVKLIRNHPEFPTITANQYIVDDNGDEDEEGKKKPSPLMMWKITTELTMLYRCHRKKLFEDNFRKIARNFPDFAQRPYTKRNKYQGKRKKEIVIGDEMALRTCEETKAELVRVTKVIEKFMEEHRKKVKLGITEKPKQAVVPTTRRKPTRKELQAIEAHKVKYQSALGAHDIEQQKEIIFNKFETEYKKQADIFKNPYQNYKIHSLNLLERISVLHIQDFPSNWIIRMLPKIDKTNTYLLDAKKFIENEKIHWPHIHLEVIFMDFLFNPQNHVKKSEAILLIALLIDLQEDFRFTIKREFLKYLLGFEFERKILGLELEPPEFPIATIRAPLPWKCSKQIAKNRLEEILMTTHPVLQAISILWRDLYCDLCVVDMYKFYEEKIPFHADKVTEFFRTSCFVMKDILMNDWLPRVADIIDIMRPFWRNLVPKNNPSSSRGIFLFKCIHALMSYQLTQLISKSIDNFYNTLIVYKEGNSRLDKVKIKRVPFMTISVSVVGKTFSVVENENGDKQTPELYAVDDDDPMLGFNDSQMGSESDVSEMSVNFLLKNSGKMYIDPYMEDLEELFVKYFKKILRVGYKIPRMEYYMTKDEKLCGYLHTIQEDHVDMLHLYDKVKDIVKANLIGPTIYLYPIYSYYFPLLAGKMKSITEHIFSQRRVPELPVVQELMDNFTQLSSGICILQNFVPLNLFMLDNRNVNNTLVGLVNEIRNFVLNYFVTLNQVENRRICDEFEDISLHAGERPKETPEVVALQNYLTECREERLFLLKTEIKTIVATRILFLLSHTLLDADDINLNSRTFLWPDELDQVLDLSANRLNVVRDNLEEALRERRTEFEAYVLQESKKLDAFRVKAIRDVLTIDDLKEKVKTVDELMDVLDKCSREAGAISTEEHLLQLEISSFPVLIDMMDKMDVIEKLWRTAYQFEICYENWYFGNFMGFDAKVIQDEIDMMYKTLVKLIKQLVGNPQARRVAEQMRLKVDKFKNYLPVLDSICRQGMSQRHWDQISEELGEPVTPELYPTLNSMIDVGIMNMISRLEEISNAAGKEFELNIQLVEMQKEWLNVKFALSPYRDSDTHILAALDDVQLILDDHILKSQSMRGSPYIGALGSLATDWEDKLIMMQDTLDIWVQVQSTWMYLEPIFSSEDIMKQMPTEGRNFKVVDRTWRKIMKNTANDKRVIQATDYPNLLKILQTSFNELEEIQKGLNMYLEKKRLYFARFFFLSNDELLEILSETKDPHRVQPHLKKCFEGINSLDFDQSTEIIGMISSDYEIVPFVRKIVPNAANGLVEKWLKEVLYTMFDSLKAQMRLCYDQYWVDARKDWMLKWPGQAILTISCMAWTEEVEEAITKETLTEYHEKCQNQIFDSINHFQSKLKPSTSQTIEALIVLDVHGRDIVEMLDDKSIKSVEDFNWSAQLRYYWKIDAVSKQDYISVNMVATDVRYGMEYLGNQPRLVVTPLTDRCYRTLMGAIKVNLGGAPEGPAGTGKTETCKDLAKAVAKKCVVFNCSSSLDYKAIGKFLKGLAQSGAWACFDEFNRMELEVLSVVAQQILSIQRAITRKVQKFMFEDTVLQLDPTCTIFITMNPGYAGRTDLPDNLKMLFRTVAMMVPDYALIGEISLYSCGFKEARILSVKIVQTYKLCSEQLSSQSHYDYGMRAIKSVLIAAANLKKQNPTLKEPDIVLRAIIDVNLPKFLEDDILLFEGIYKDLFPEIEVFVPSRADIQKWLPIKIKEKRLQPTPWFIDKILQIYEMILVRHGVMIVGETMGGKTSAYQLLAEVLKAISTDKDCDNLEYAVSYRIINPKAITIDQLYGCFDPVSHEWSDGILAKTFRDMANSVSNERQWIVFDGPVDADWIENLNTTLDDNKKLCLMSGEIVAMSSRMTLLFEPADLEQASPATISRVGMIYMEPTRLGWESFHLSFVNDLAETGINELYLALYESLVDWLVPAMLEILENCTRIINVTPMYSYRMMTVFFMYFFSKNEEHNQIWFQQTFLFCLVWGYGSTLTIEGRKIVDSLLRKILYGSNENYPKPKNFSLNRGQMFPEKMTVYDYRYDEKEAWWPWFKADDTNIPADVTLSELIVTTKETGYLSFWLDVCLKRGLPIMLIGPTGTGKSAVVSNTMLELPKQKFVLNTINFSSRTTANQVQDIIMSKLDRRRKGVFGPPVGKKCVVFLDDIGMPACDEYGSQSPLELLRQWIDHKHWSDLKDTSKLEIVDMLLVSAMGLIGGSNFIYPRLYRHNFVVGVDALEDTTVARIFTTISEWHFDKDYPENVVRHAKNVSSAIIQVFRNASLNFLPIPSKSHYLFSLRDVTRVFQGIVLVPASRLPNPEKLVRLWLHEVYRAFSDKLNDGKDRVALLQMVQAACFTNFKMSMEAAMGDRMDKGEKVSERHIRNLIFGNFMEPDAYPKIYDEIENLDKLENVMNYYLNEYNSMSKSPMNLVLFRFAIEHISRTSRIMQMQRGNILMVGLGGSGRRSSIKLCASMSDIELFQIVINKSYSKNDWRDDLKKLLFRTGLDGKPTVFLFSDSQAKQEYFIEDISSLLNTGEVTNLFQSEDKAHILEEMQNVAKNATKQIDMTAPALYAFFIERIREYLHIALAFSPIGDMFKQRLRNYPSLANCCTIDWFTEWPDDALVKVAENFIKTMNINRVEDISSNTGSSTISISRKNQDDDVDRPLDESESKIIEIILELNQMITVENENFFNELGRRNYVTPTSYLEMLRSFKILYDRKYSEITMMRDRYITGLDKLENAAGQVAVMQENLYELQPQLKVTSEETEKIMVNIERETAEAEKKKEVVGADEAAANEAAAAAQAIKDDCESDLQEAIPALEAALSALDTLKPADITVVKSMKNPPGGVKLVLEAVCVIKGIKPDRKPDATGRMTEDYWGPAQKMLGDMKFLESLKAFDKNNIPEPVMKKIRDTYIADRDFVPEKIKNISTACEGLCCWVRAMEIYDRVAKIVAPKKIALAEAEKELQTQMEKLNEKKEELMIILNKLQKLNDYFAEKSKEKKNLEDEIDNCEKKLVRAAKLLGGLGGEKTRWSESAKTLDNSLVNVVGDVLLAAGCVAYLGCFTTSYRQRIISKWNEICLAKQIPCDKQFSLIKTLGSEIDIRNWTICGLPVDDFSKENGIIVTHARRWPLMIDPQIQANKWIKNLEMANNLKVIKLSDDNYTRLVEDAIKYGYPILLENIAETIDFDLYPILEKNIFKQNGVNCIRFGDGTIEYHENFRFYMTTCLSNPHYLPETAVMVTLINFSITELGLKQQLLTTVVIQEKPELQEKKEQLIVESAKNRTTLYNIETKILQVLSSSEGNILEDENAINILSSSKVLSEDIIVKQSIADVTEKEIDSARQLYIPVSNHSAVLFFCLTELVQNDPMYHFSLLWFLNLFVQIILKTPKSDILEERLEALKTYFTRSIYENVCRSLFEKDKLIFSFTMCLGILRSQNRIDSNHLRYLLQGNTDLSNPYPNPASEWLSDKSWSSIVGASQLEGLEDFHKIFQDNLNQWREFYNSENPNELPYPEPYSSIDRVLKLIILKALRPDKIVPAVKEFIAVSIGETFVEPPPFNLNESFNDSSPKIPLIFLLSPGTDPAANIVAFAREKNMYDRFKQISLGQGQGPKAIKMMMDGVKFGHWVILQNIHVAESWMDSFEKFCNDLQLNENIHSDFRLWCTSYPSEIFPVSVLQSSVKMTNESPKGLKLCIKKLLNTDPLANDKFFTNAFYEGSDIGKFWLRGTFSLVFFHAVVLGRREFGPLGWNIPYEFNESDLRISLMQMKMFIRQYNNIPFEGHTYLTGECNYGGRVTDDKDRRLLSTILVELFNKNSIAVDNYRLSESGLYQIPLEPNRVNSLQYVESLPDIPNPEVFGLHENADIVKNINECNALFYGVLLTQSQLQEKSKGTNDDASIIVDPVAELCITILEKLPNLFDLKQIEKKFPITYHNSMNTVLKQEAIRYNVLIEVIRDSLLEMQKAIAGIIAMVPQLEDVYMAMQLGRIPKLWANKCYPCLKNLSGFVHDLIDRLTFFQNWCDNGEPAAFWISGFYFTQSFLTGVLQNFSRRHKLQIDLIEILLEVTDFETDVLESSEMALYTKGLFLEGARWDRQNKTLEESYPKILYDCLPILKMTHKFKDDKFADKKKEYDCPVYKTCERRGTLSTTGHSTNFVMMIPLKTKNHKPNHWIKRGTACLLQLSD